MLKICGVFLLAASAAMILAETKEKYAKLLCICAGILAAFAALALLVPMIGTLQELMAESTAGPYFSIMLRALGIGLITEFTALTVKEMGQATLAGHVELIGKLFILTQLLPLFETLLTFAKGLLQ